MTNHDHQHDHHHGHHHEHPPRKRGVHKDWRAWLVVILMLAAMWMYLRTMDESIQPDGQLKPGMPAAPGPPAPAPVGMLLPVGEQSQFALAEVHSFGDRRSG
jgi:hypothetical protein